MMTLLQDELTVSMLEKCKESQPVIQRIIESTTDDEVMLFEALNLHDELQQVISKYEELEIGQKSDGELPLNSDVVKANPSDPVETPKETSSFNIGEDNTPDHAKAHIETQTPDATEANLQSHVKANESLKTADARKEGTKTSSSSSDKRNSE